jgi:nucleoside-diphosphate-sugar epimerase
VTEPNRILVTGASGFVGGALVFELLKRGFHVTAAVRKVVDFPTVVRVVSIGNLDATTDWREALQNCTAVVHCAARVHVMRPQGDDSLEQFREVNVVGATHLARQAFGAGVRRFVFISTVKVNGSSTAGRAFTEQDTPAPTDPYSISKWEAEQALREVCSKAQAELVVIRPPLVYGPGVKANFLNMAKWIQRGVPLPLGRVVHNRRTLVAVDNLIDLIIATLTHPAAANQVFFAGDGDDMSTSDLLRRTARALRCHARLLPMPEMVLRMLTVIARRPDIWERLGGSLQCSIEHARRRIGWVPRTSVEEALKRTVAPLLDRGPL